MVMYAVGTKPLIDQLSGITKLVWYADDSSAGSTLVNLRRLWDKLKEIGPRYGHFPNSSKTCILTKPYLVEQLIMCLRVLTFPSLHKKKLTLWELSGPLCSSNNS